jgi:hypothetical protein
VVEVPQTTKPSNTMQHLGKSIVMVEEKCPGSTAILQKQASFSFEAGITTSKSTSKRISIEDEKIVLSASYNKTRNKIELELKQMKKNRILPINSNYWQCATMISNYSRNDWQCATMISNYSRNNSISA